MQQNLLEEINSRGIGQQGTDISMLRDALKDLKEEFETMEEEEGAVQMKSWIEQ